MLDKWHFDELGSGMLHGWNDPGMGHFRINRLKSLTREILQNSLDNSADESKPIEVEFELIELNRGEIPGIDSLTERLELIKANMEQESANAQREIVKALDTSQKPRIPVLRITDRGTTGLVGPCREGKPFFTYLKTTGTSADGSRGGSHGLGKNAPLCCSSLRTIILATDFFDESNQLSDLVMGRTTLMGLDHNGQAESPQGFLGNRFNPISKDQHDFEWLKRGDEAGTGTSIFVLGFELASNWSDQLIAHAISSFFAAFHRKALVLHVKKRRNSIRVNDENLPTYFESTEITDSISEEDKEQLDWAKYYYEVIRTQSKSVVEELKELRLLKKSSVKIIVNDAFGEQRFAIIRKNMLITDKLSTFYRRHVSSMQNFAGVFECETEEGADKLRRMEPPRHDSLDAEQLPHEEISKGQKILKELGGCLKDFARANAGIAADSMGAVDWMADWLQDEGNEDDHKKGQEEDPNGNFLTPTPKPLPRKTYTKFIAPSIDDGEDDNDEGEEGGSGGSSGGGGGGGSGHGFGEGSGTGGSGTRGREPSPENGVAIAKFRSIRITETKHKLIIRASTSQKTEVQLHEIGGEGIEDILITESNFGVVENGRIVCSLDREQASVIEVSLARPLRGGLYISLTNKEAVS